MRKYVIHTPVIVKISIISLWIVTLFGFLYFPLLLKFFVDEKALNVVTFSDIINPKVAEDFEKQTGIKIHFSYFENNEELLLKLRTTGAKGYDLILVSDYIIEQLIKDQLLKTIDRTKLDFWNRLNPSLQGLYFDPENRYTVPYSWTIYGLGFDKNYFKNKPIPSWDLIFKPSGYNIGILDNPREVVLLAANYLYGTIDNLSKIQLDAIQNLLIQQKAWIEAYTEYRADYLLLSKAAPVVVIATPYFLRLAKTVDTIDFLIPEEGTFNVIDSFILPKYAREDLAYQFLNFLYQPSIINFHASINPFLPATVEIEEALSGENVPESIVRAHMSHGYKLQYFRDTVSNKLLNSLWMNLKAS